LYETKQSSHQVLILSVCEVPILKDINLIPEV